MKYRNREFGFEIEYDKNNWEGEKIEGQNSGILLINKNYNTKPPVILIKGWYPPQIHLNEEVVKDLGVLKIGRLVVRKRIINHQFFKKPLELFINFETWGIQFLYIGRVEKTVAKEFEEIAKSFRLIHEKD